MVTGDTGGGGPGPYDGQVAAVVCFLLLAAGVAGVLKLLGAW